MYALESFSNYLILEVPEKGYLSEKLIFPMIESGAAHCNLTEKDLASCLFSKISKSARYTFLNHKETISFCQITFEPVTV